MLSLDKNEMVAVFIIRIQPILVSISSWKTCVFSLT